MAQSENTSSWRKIQKSGKWKSGNLSSSPGRHKAPPVSQSHSPRCRKGFRSPSTSLEGTQAPTCEAGPDFRVAFKLSLVFPVCKKFYLNYLWVKFYINPICVKFYISPICVKFYLSPVCVKSLSLFHSSYSLLLKNHLNFTEAG